MSTIHKSIIEFRGLLPEYAVYCIASETIKGYAGIMVLIARAIEPLLCAAPLNFGAAAP